MSLGNEKEVSDKKFPGSCTRSQRFRRLFKEGFWIVLGQAMSVVGSLIGVRLLTELLAPAAYGELALGMTVATLVNQAVLGPLSNGVMRFYAPAVEQDDFGGYLNAVKCLVLSATGVTVILILTMVVGLLIAGQTKMIGIAIAAFIFAILSGYNSILSGIQNAARQRAIVALHQGMESWARFLVAAGLLMCLSATSTMAIVGYAVAAILVLGSQYVFFKRIVPKGVTGQDKKEDWQKEMWNFSWPISIFGMFTWLQLASDRWALNLCSTVEDVGLYAVVFLLGYYPMSIATGMVMQFFAPIFYKRAGDANDSLRTANVNRLSYCLAGLALAVTICAFLLSYIFHTKIFKLFVAKEFASVSNLLPWMLLAGGVFTAGQSISLNLQSQMKTRVMMAPKIITALLGVFLNFIGAYLYGTSGVVMAGVLFSASYFLWMVVLSKHK
ncbi:MAG: lipopolysaccharide biosynthesis protein [Desulfobacteraceae bacterium]|nr:MAG: lipopolysaccharide biosynthesis protein [Desulfobacteraceae bacterium]